MCTQLAFNYVIAESTYHKHLTKETYCLRQCKTPRPCACDRRKQAFAAAAASRRAGKVTKLNGSSDVTAFLAAKIGVDKACAHFENGTCVRAVQGRQCFFKHSTPAAPAAATNE